ncbi:acyl-CoA dehydrogenase family protein [Actinomadura sp. HBU206391]|uniref:acyl-CoA dehydrogenase family protein n=1 Tax=Actinomadura sp. HBU206391 TaxID=2731692 RepID=UPI00164FE037|nr:acyl-CoA dehydrogenase family protein [Actinomadura sp. HBU206391]MBC6457811.1 acyl-CoA dehydrogenase family protein [Actinomadura sp. HBU206391]
MRREIFTEEHEAFRDTVRSFIAKEITPHHEQWEKDGVVSRDVWLAAGRQGLLGIDVDERYGGGGNADFRYYMILDEELAKAGAHGPGFAVHNDINGSYLIRLSDEEQKRRWLPGYCSGEIITAIAMTEPAAGSDLQGIKTTAVRDGDDYVLNGSKTFISNGILADLVIVVAKTDPSAGAKGVSLLVVERGMAGFERGRNLDKVGLHAQDTAELFFDEVRVPKANLLGEEGMGFIYLMQNLARERLSIGAAALAGAEASFERTLEYCKTREAFGRPIGRFQHNRFTLAEMKTELTVARAFTDTCVLADADGELTAEEAAMLKYWNTELLKTVVDRCVQLYGGYGYMTEYPIAKAYQDARIHTIFGGTTEIMKEIIGRSLGV